MSRITVAIPRPFAAFSSVQSSDSPFDALRLFIAREAGLPDLSFSGFSLNPSDFAEFRWQVWRYLHMRGEVEKLESLSEAGRTAPCVSRACAPGFAEVA